MLAVLVAANLLNNRYARSAYLATSPVAVAVLLALYALSGHPWADAGLGAGTLGRGVRWGLVLGALVALGCLAGALLPVTRAAFLDRRVADDGPGAVAYQVLLRIPLGTVLLEEVAFRGVLYGLLRTPSSAGWATAVSAGLFRLLALQPPP